MQVRKNVGLSCCEGEMRHVKQSSVCGSDDAAVGELDSDAIGGGTTIDAVAVNFEKMTGAT